MNGDGPFVSDRSDLARLLATGPDILDLLHRLSTGDLKGLKPGDGRPTVLTSPKGRIVARLSVHHLGQDGVLLVGGPGAADGVLAHLKKFTFAEDTGLADRTASTSAFALLGRAWAETAREAGLPELAPYGASVVSIAQSKTYAIGTNGFNDDGMIVICDREDGERVEAALVAAAARLGGAVVNPGALEVWRVLNGIPAQGAELTEEHNPLEAGLREAISFTKGCYVGQEIVARLNTYDKVSRELVRLELAPGAPLPARGAVVRHDGREIGAVTSAVRVPGEELVVALAYLRTRDVTNDQLALTIDGGGAARIAARLSR